MTDPFPATDRDRMLRLVERDPKLRPIHLEYDGEWWLKRPTTLHSILFVPPHHAAALCRDAMRDMLETIGTLKTGYARDDYPLACVSILIPWKGDISTSATTMLTALIGATEAALDAKEKSNG